MGVHVYTEYPPWFGFTPSCVLWAKSVSGAVLRDFRIDLIRKAGVNGWRSCRGRRDRDPARVYCWGAGGDEEGVSADPAGEVAGKVLRSVGDVAGTPHAAADRAEVLHQCVMSVSVKIRSMSAGLVT